MTVLSSTFTIAAAALLSCARAARLSDAQLVALYGRAPAAAPRALLAPRDAAQSLRDAAAAAGVFVGAAIDENYIRNTSEPYGAIAAGQIMPRSSWFCSTAAPRMRVTPMP